MHIIIRVLFSRDSSVNSSEIHLARNVKPLNLSRTIFPSHTNILFLLHCICKRETLVSLTNIVFALTNSFINYDVILSRNYWKK
jgi:hypothetical protein